MSRRGAAVGAGCRLAGGLRRIGLCSHALGSTDRAAAGRRGRASRPSRSLPSRPAPPACSAGLSPALPCALVSPQPHGSTTNAFGSPPAQLPPPLAQLHRRRRVLVLEPGHLTLLLPLPLPCSRHHPPRRSVSSSRGDWGAAGRRIPAWMQWGGAVACVAKRHASYSSCSRSDICAGSCRARHLGSSRRVTADTTARHIPNFRVFARQFRLPTPPGPRPPPPPSCLQRRGGGARVCGEPPRRAGRPGGRRCRPDRVLRTGEAS